MTDRMIDLHKLSTEQHDQLAHTVMKRQASLSLRVALVFIVLLFGVPLINNFMPELANRPIMGITATWLFLGVLFFPITWLLSAYFVKNSNRIEEECMDWRAVLGQDYGEPLEPEGIGDVKPAFIASDLPSSLQTNEEEPKKS